MSVFFFLIGKHGVLKQRQCTIEPLNCIDMKEQVPLNNMLCNT